MNSETLLNSETLITSETLMNSETFTNYKTLSNSETNDTGVKTAQNHCKITHCNPAWLLDVGTRIGENTQSPGEFRDLGSHKLSAFLELKII